MPRGIPDALMHQDRRTRHIPPQLLPPPDEAVQSYRENVGRLTDPAPFRHDPLESNNDKLGNCI